MGPVNTLKVEQPILQRGTRKTKNKRQHLTFITNHPSPITQHGNTTYFNNKHHSSCRPMTIFETATRAQQLVLEGLLLRTSEIESFTTTITCLSTNIISNSPTLYPIHINPA
ncbi:unnamed protein product [Ambrosiozyma monospora]|uniref:Unnamed protein product n=1 Tax=Ambrosiozyma monospora TaxID=43982 RepID=A0A9W6WLZ8_AMBMO|nr:unnamed protein product [Ambrosiozyma monospora]